MNIKLLVVGKTEAMYLREGIAEYEKRLKRYISFELCVLPDIKNAAALRQEQLREKEGVLILEHVHSGDELMLLDARGKQYSSPQFAEFLQRKMNAATKQLVFVVGGAYGFSQAVYERANAMLSLSAMTFSHQMVRLFFVEQLYRAYTILRGEPYHHEG